MKEAHQVNVYQILTGENDRCGLKSLDRYAYISICSGGKRDCSRVNRHSVTQAAYTLHCHGRLGRRNESHTFDRLLLVK